VIEIGALQTLAFHAAGKPSAALSTLVEVLALGHPEGYMRVFADEGHPMALLLRKLAAAGKRGRQTGLGAIPMDYLGRLLQAVEPNHDSRQYPARVISTGIPGVANVLTDREAEVLALLATGKQNREIADELVVTLDTVKKHVTHILDKLGAANRTQAVARARELALIR
jgi:LuxR family maltose regulon positive regulatory protein